MENLLSFVMFPLGAAFLTAILSGWLKKAGDLLANGAALILCVFSFVTLHSIFAQGAIIYKVGGWIPPAGICLVADGLAALMLVVVNLVSFLIMIYASSYMRVYTDKWKFYSLFMLMLAGMNGVILSGDLFNLYVFLELASISGYALVSFGTEAKDLEASFKYAIMGSLASVFILLGIALLYSYSSTLNMADISYVLSAKPHGVLVKFISVLFLAGFGLKTALVPFHAWLPDAHSSAPSPVSAALSGVFIKTVGIYALARVFFCVMGADSTVLYVLMILGMVSMVVGAFLAVAQDDIKRMFAYSSISQIGTIVFALGIGTPLAILGGLFHLFNHAVFKSLLFLNAGAIEQATQTRSLKKLGGLFAKLPVTGSTSLVAAMSISGIPPLSGFWSKLIIIMASVQAGYFGFAVIAVVISIVTLAYYLKFQTFALFGKLGEACQDIKEAPFAMKFSMIVLAVICVVGGAMLMPALRPYMQQAADVLVSPNTYKQLIFDRMQNLK